MLPETSQENKQEEMSWTGLINHLTSKHLKAEGRLMSTVSCVIRLKKPFSKMNSKEKFPVNGLNHQLSINDCFLGKISISS